MKDLDLITVGYHKGEMDFGVCCAVGDLSMKEMNNLRMMVVVAIGSMEDMWRRNQEEETSAKFQSD